MTTEATEALPEDALHVIPADAPPGDHYGREHAAKLLGISPRRVSQLADEGRFDIVQRKPLRLSAESVHRMRDERRAGNAGRPATVPPPSTEEVTVAIVEQVRAIADAAERMSVRALESKADAIAAKDDALADARAERDRALADAARMRQEVEQLRASLDELRDEMARRRRWL